MDDGVAVRCASSPWDASCALRRKVLGGHEGVVSSKAYSARPLFIFAGMFRSYRCSPCVGPDRGRIGLDCERGRSAVHSKQVSTREKGCRVSAVALVMVGESELAYTNGDGSRPLVPSFNGPMRQNPGHWYTATPMKSRPPRATWRPSKAPLCRHCRACPGHPRP
jgi:hypothetical protein